MVKQNRDNLSLTLKREVDDSYDIVFGRDMFPRIARDLSAKHPNKFRRSKYAIITDSNVGPLYGGSLEDVLKTEGLEVNIFSFEAGEKSKTAETCLRIAGEMAKLKYDRDSMILALGGGVVGDMAGWIAANYLRGIPFIQIPTTILAQADSSVGGKTGVDLEWGKNLFGAFKQPLIVYVDVEVLKTLNEKEIRNGLVETIKHGVIQDADFFGYLEDSLGLLLEKDPNPLLFTAFKNCYIKGSVVEQDPHEKGLRRILNYGHTVGHAIEKLSGYKLSHGESVAIGMMAAGRIARKYGFPESDLERQEELLVAAGLPTTIPLDILDREIIEVTTRDKKAKNGRARYCLPLRIGQMHEFDGVYAVYVENDVVLRALDETR